MRHPGFKSVLASLWISLLFEAASGFAAAGAELAVEVRSPVQSTLELLQVLEGAPTGAYLLQEARKAGYDPKASRDWLTLGKVSKTDAVITRTLNPQSGEEKLERRLLIQIRRNQPVLEAVLNLAHELVHAIDGHQIDPYDANLSLGFYLKQSIEGVGGEVFAVAAECRVSYELQKRFHWSEARCGRYELSGMRVNLSKIRQDFYRVGESKDWVLRSLGEDAKMFPLLSDLSPILYSSTGQAPYPVALVKEFEGLTQVACRNSVDRLRSLLEPADGGRQPASVSGAVSTSSSGDRKAQIKEKTREFIAERCTAKSDSPSL